jgi:hypothetical protein
MARRAGPIVSFRLPPRAAPLPFPPLNDIRRGMVTMARPPKRVPDRRVSD